MSTVAEWQERLTQAEAWMRGGSAVALATVTETWGSAPRPAGSLLLINAAGDFAGSVSGGCVETSVLETAQAVMAHGVGQRLEFGVSDETAWQVGLACGGRIRIYVERLDGSGISPWRATLNALAASRAGAVIELDLARGTRRWLLDGVPELQRDPWQSALRSERAGTAATEQGALFLQPLCAPARLLIVGAVHIAEALSPLAQRCGYAVTLIDPRQAFLRAGRFAGAELSDQWPDRALLDRAPDGRTALVTLAHDPKIDDPALRVALGAQTFYIGALGSRRTHEKRLERLLAAGLSAEALTRIHGPAGLNIGARTPEEIAVSILAELTLARRGTKS